MSNKAGSEKVGDTMDLIHLVQSDISNLSQQIDELVVRAEEVDESFNCVLLEMHSSLKTWISTLQKATSSIQSPEPSKTECFVSPSPLVSWCATDCTVEMDKQLFALSPLPRLKTASLKGQSMSKSVALQRHNSSASVFPCCFSNVANSAENVEKSSAHVAKKMKTTPCLKWSPGRYCNSNKLLEPNSGFSCRNFDSEYKSTPFLLGKQRLSKYSSSILNSVISVASPTWCMSPPKTCVLKDPGALSGAFEQSINFERCGILFKGSWPSENTLKEELWEKFQAATTTVSKEHKGFLYMLEEAS